MARFVKSKFFPNAPCNIMILLRKNGVCGSNLFPDSMGLRPLAYAIARASLKFEPLPRLAKVSTHLFKRRNF